jgi:carboxymethylenebutenolidase
MSEQVKLQAEDGHELDAYVARPAGETVGGLVLIQEIFGINKHIRSVVDGYAKDGFLVIAPALFDRTEKNVELEYGGDGGKRAYELMGTLTPETALLDVGAALNWVRAESGQKAGTVGYCYGGLLAWLSATRLDPSAAVGYYAGGIGHFAAEVPKCPVMLHFGKLDTHIPKEQVDKVAAAHPDVSIYWYEGAEHGFNRDVWTSYNPEAAKLARGRSVEFLKRYLA